MVPVNFSLMVDECYQVDLAHSRLHCPERTVSDPRADTETTYASNETAFGRCQPDVVLHVTHSLRMCLVGIQWPWKGHKSTLSLSQTLKDLDLQGYRARHGHICLDRDKIRLNKGSDQIWTRLEHPPVITDLPTSNTVSICYQYMQRSKLSSRFDHTYQRAFAFTTDLAFPRRGGKRLLELKSPVQHRRSTPLADVFNLKATQIEAGGKRETGRAIIGPLAAGRLRDHVRGSGHY